VRSSDAKTDSALPGKPRAHSARRTAGLGVTIVEGVLVDETENVRPFIVRAHHELTARRESAPQRLILIAGRVCAFQTPDKGVALLLGYDERGKPTAPPFDLGNPVPSAGSSALSACSETGVARINEQIRAFTAFIWEPPCCQLYR
jgi:hypothetical protein